MKLSIKILRENEYTKDILDTNLKGQEHLNIVDKKIKLNKVQRLIGYKTESS